MFLIHFDRLLNTTHTHGATILRLAEYTKKYALTNLSGFSPLPPTPPCTGKMKRAAGKNQCPHAPVPTTRYNSRVRNRYACVWPNLPRCRTIVIVRPSNSDNCVVRTVDHSGDVHETNFLFLRPWSSRISIHGTTRGLLINFLTPIRRARYNYYTRYFPRRFRSNIRAFERNDKTDSISAYKRHGAVDERGK